MPTYDYLCEDESCKHRFDSFHSILDAAKKKCPACGRSSLVRLISGGGGIIFKGDDWSHKGAQYITDRARDNPTGEVGIN